jgi:hypothetical protein
MGQTGFAIKSEAQTAFKQQAEKIYGKANLALPGKQV